MLFYHGMFHRYLAYPLLFSCFQIFVARVANHITEQDLRSHFEQFGEITDLFYPKPQRGFAFVTFKESQVAKSLVGKDHIVKDCSIHIGEPQPKPDNNYQASFGDYRGGGFEVGHYGGGGGRRSGGDGYGGMKGGSMGSSMGGSGGYGSSGGYGGSGPFRGDDNNGSFQAYMYPGGGRGGSGSYQGGHGKPSPWCD